MKSGFLDNMAPNAQRALILTLILAGVATGLFMFAVVPAQEALAAAQTAREEAENTKRSIARRLAHAERQRAELAGIQATLDAYRPALLERKLGTYITHACQILYPLANGTGLADVKVDAEPNIRFLPLPNPRQEKSPRQRHVRVGVRLTARGSFQKAVSLLIQLERSQPLATLREMRLSRLATNDKEQQIDMTFEWPALMAEPDDARKAGATTKGKRP